MKDDLKKVGAAVSAEDRRLLDEHATFVREMEQELKAAAKDEDRPRGAGAGAGREGRTTTTSRSISKMQIDLMVNSFAADFARVATLQFTNSVGGARMRWLGVDEGHHELSHEPDNEHEGPGEADEDQQVVLRAAGLPGEAPGRDAGAGRQRQPARQHADRLDERAGQGQLAHAGQHPVRAGRQRARLQDGPVAQVQRSAAQPAAAVAGARLRPSHRTFGNPNFCGGGPLPNLT